jgi:hypothetical protein
MFAISPTFNHSKLQSGTVEDKAEVFADQINGWLLDHAHALASPAYERSQHAGFVILQILSSYFEMIASFLKGESSDRRSAEFWAHGFFHVFPELENQVRASGVANPEKQLAALESRFYAQVRCGLVHEGLTRNSVVVARGTPHVFKVTADRNTGQIHHIEIDPFQLVGSIQANFDEYISNLKDASQLTLRASFTREWARRMSE